MTMRKFLSPSEFATPLTTTLNLYGMEWGYFTHEGHLALGYQRFAIHWDPSLKQYVFKFKGDILFSDIEMAKCLDMIPGIVFETISNEIFYQFNHGQ